MAQGPSDTILVAIRITLWIRESKVRNPDPPDRRRFVLSECFQVATVIVADFFEFSLVKHTRGHRFKLFKRRSNTCARSSIFSERVVNAWNSLPRDTNFNSVAGSKRSMANVDFTEFLKVDFMSS